MYTLGARAVGRVFAVQTARSLHIAAHRPQVLHRALQRPRRANSTKPYAEQVAKNRAEQLADWTAPVVSYDRVKELTEQPTENVYLIDVREPDEVAQGSIPSSVSVPLSGFANSMHLDEAAFLEKHGFNKPKPDNHIILYCRSGKRSASASDIARRSGYTNVFNYEGSWLDWASRHGIPAS